MSLWLAFLGENERFFRLSVLRDESNALCGPSESKNKSQSFLTFNSTTVRPPFFIIHYSFLIDSRFSSFLPPDSLPAGWCRSGRCR